MMAGGSGDEGIRDVMENKGKRSGILKGEGRSGSQLSSEMSLSPRRVLPLLQLNLKLLNDDASPTRPHSDTNFNSALIHAVNN
ncbi:hypothetical protein E2C01_088022 [Portunus trituberculatus]|uniref:Uncharacterized protein n=1 Tax=Portunus trituberculatus TaxID=210409 RepID=A0A5B7JDD5_PORTR|nr:hypothetical protein [Portunus trituberculatus]